MQASKFRAGATSLKEGWGDIQQSVHKGYNGIALNAKP